MAETMDSIREWADETFGPISMDRLLDRADEEYEELWYEYDKGNTSDVLEEAADVVICLARLPGLWEMIEKKMAKNRAREWEVVGDGTGYHIKR